MNKRLLLVGIILLFVGVLTAPFAFGPTLGVTGVGDFLYVSGAVTGCAIILILISVTESSRASE